MVLEECQENSFEEEKGRKEGAADAAIEILRRRRARSNLIDFTKYTFPQYVVEPAHQLIASKLEAVVNGDIKRLMIFAPPQHGKALSIDTLIPTPTGWSTIMDLKVGDEVFSRDGLTCRVIAKSEILENRPCFKLITDDRFEIIADENHLWFVRVNRWRRKREEIKTTKFLYEYKKLCSRNFKVSNTKPVKLPEVDLIIHPYVLGAWLGDGSSGDSGLCCGYKDREILSNIGTCGVSVNRYKHKDIQYRLGKAVFRRKEDIKECFKVKLQELGLLNNKHIPMSYLRASESQRRELLQGLMDIAGYIDKDGQIGFGNTNKKLVEGVRELVVSLGYKAVMYEGRATLYGNDCGPSWSVCWYGVGAFKLSRKKFYEREPKKKHRYVNIVPCDSVPVQCIQVDSIDGSFLCGKGMVPTHNSELASVRFPAYWLARRPDDPIILCSYGASLAESKSRQARQVVESREYKLLFEGLGTSRDSRSVTEWHIDGGRGSLLAAGVSGAITGRGAMCFPVGTLVTTEFGVLPIEKVASFVGKIRVLSFNHDTKLVEWRNICASRRVKAREFVRVRTNKGREVCCTPNHEIFTCKEGYRQARSLRRNQEVITNNWEKERGLSCLREGKNRENIWLDLQRMLFCNKKNRIRNRMQLVQKNIFSRKELGGEGCFERYKKQLLFQGMFKQSYNTKEQGGCWSSKILHYLQRGSSSKVKKVLRRLSSKNQFEKVSSQRNLSKLWRNVLLWIKQKNVLFKILCGSLAFQKDERKREFSLHKWKKQKCFISQNKTSNFGERWEQVCYLWLGKSNGNVWKNEKTTNKFESTSYQQVRVQQSSPIKFNSFMQKVSWDSSYDGNAWETESISSVEEFSSSSQYVYDIQVEGNSNFFANGILVHNCGLIDDPVKDWEEAQSERIRDICWDWYCATFLTRVWENGAIVLIQTRWHEDDLAGRLLREQASDWEVVRLPAIAETQQERDENNEFLFGKDNSRRGEPDPLGRSPGEALCPRKFSSDFLESTKRAMGSGMFASLYQGVPRPAEGNIFKRSWFQTVDSVPYGAKRVRGWDKAASSREGDYSVGSLMAFHEGVFYVEDVVRGKWSAGDRDKIMKATADRDALRYKNSVSIWVEQEPGSGGKESAQNTVRLLAGFPIYVEKVTGPKEVRANPFASQASGGNVRLVRGSWNNEFLTEFLTFPNGTHDDIVDSTCLAFNKLAGFSGLSPTLKVYSIRGAGTSAVKNKQLKIAICNRGDLENLTFDQECLLISIRDPDVVSTIPPHRCQKLLGRLDLSFIDIDPNADECSNWDEVIIPYGKKPEELIMSREQGKRLWGFITKKRDVNPSVIIVQDNGDKDRRAISIAIAICETLFLSKSKTLCLAAYPDSKVEDGIINKHVVSLVKSTRHTVI